MTQALFSVLAIVAFANNASAQSYECDDRYQECGTPEQSGGGGCGCGGGSILVNNTDLGDTYQYADDYDDDGIEQFGRRRIDRMGDREVRMRLAMRTAPETAEMRALATKTVEVEMDSPGYEHGWAVVVTTDRLTGRERRMRVRSFKDMRIGVDHNHDRSLRLEFLLTKFRAGLVHKTGYWPRQRSYG